MGTSRGASRPYVFGPPTATRGSTSAESSLHIDALERETRLDHELLERSDVPDGLSGPAVHAIEEQEDLARVEHGHEHRLGALRFGLAEDPIPRRSEVLRANHPAVSTRTAA